MNLFEKTSTPALVDVDSSSLLERYYALINECISEYGSPSRSEDFAPPMRLPKLDARMSEFLSPTTASLCELGEYRGYPLRLLDLRQNPNTQTTKTFASLIIVARAIHFIQETGQSVLLFSPSSGNKAVALRDAVARALAADLAKPEQLRIITLTPIQTIGKLRHSVLSEDLELRALNPVFVLNCAAPEAVKQVGQEFKRLLQKQSEHRVRLWYSLQLENYRIADQVRAFFDYEFGNASRVDQCIAHAHSVSSAYGLLGYQSGVEALKKKGCQVADPAFLLVQHLATCDMVLHALTNSFDRRAVPEFTSNSEGVWNQGSCAHFPLRTWSPDEVLEHTFYTHQPPTAVEMSQLISVHDGTGIVVSLLECFERYAQCRMLLRNSAITLPEDPRRLNEWSLVMVITGVLNAIDRSLLHNINAVTIHASGTYSIDDYRPLPMEHVQIVDRAQQMLDIVLRR